MAAKKSLDEKIAEAQAKKEQYDNRLKQLLQKQKEEERKARTRRLIERGAILESLIDNAESLSNEEIQAVLVAALKNESAQKTLFPPQEKGKVGAAGKQEPGALEGA